MISIYAPCCRTKRAGHVSVCSVFVTGNSLPVQPDGRLHLELRRQELFDGRAVLTTYESALDGTEIGSKKW